MWFNPSSQKSTMESLTNPRCSALSAVRWGEKQEKDKTLGFR